MTFEFKLNFMKNLCLYSVIIHINMGTNLGGCMDVRTQGQSFCEI